MAHGDINFDEVPGTSLLVDETNELGGKHKKDIVLIPTPSDDPNDPLNWTKRRKWLQMFCVIVYVYSTGIPGTCIYSILTQISEAPGVSISVSQLNDGTGYLFLFLGIGCWVFLPLAQQFGKRPIYLLSTLGCALLNLWNPYITTNQQWIASKILAGLFVAPIEALPEITIADLFFEHERATYMAVYGVALFTSNYMAPLVAGFINDAMGWQWVIYFAVIFCAVGFVFLSFFMEETNYERRLRVKRDANGDVLSAIVSASEKHPNTSSEEVKEYSEFHATEVVVSARQNLGNQAALIDDDDSDFSYPPEKTFWQKMSLTSGMKKKNHLLELYIGPLKMMQFPVVLYAGFLYGASLFWYSVLNGTESLILGAEPYNFSAAMCGAAYTSPVVFSIIIYFYAGWSTDWIKVKIARGRSGISHAEDRLWVLTVYMILGPAALILWGVGAANGIHWFGVVFGLGLLGGLCIIGCVSSTTYILDTYELLSSDAMIVCILIRNTMNFAMDYGITPFVTNVGVQNCFIASAFICLFCIGTFFIMILTGKYWRNRGKEAYWKLVAKRRASGLLA